MPSRVIDFRMSFPLQPHESPPSADTAGRMVAIVGGGPAGLMAAEALAARGANVHVFDRMPSLARKFLMAGRGGLNITHSEPPERFLARYESAAPRLAPYLDAFPPTALRDWCAALGEETFVGSSGRVFPKSFKASPLLRAWLRRLAAAGVSVHPRHTLVALEGTRLAIDTPVGRVHVEADAIVLACGGASWPRLGSDGSFAPLLATHGIDIAPLAPANCGFRVDWSETMRTRFAGTPIKGAAFSAGVRTVRGEAVVTDRGLEGGAVYALSAILRDEIAANGQAMLTLDLKPDVLVDVLATRLAKGRAGESRSTALKRLGLAPVTIGLLRESLPGGLPADAQALASAIKAVHVPLVAPMPIERAISTAGGVRFDEVDERLMLKKLPGVFVCGEMLDWEAPTGGYLLQACFATGRAAGEAAADWVLKT